MALFKILRGDSDSLSSVPLTDGYAYFTPDNGRFYIDAALSEIPDHCVASSNGVYRIEIRPSAADSATTADKAMRDGANNIISDTYIENLTFDYSTSTLTMYTAGGDTSTITIPPLVQVKTWTSADVTT